MHGRCLALYWKRDYEAETCRWSTACRATSAAAGLTTVAGRATAGATRARLPRVLMRAFRELMTTHTREIERCVRALSRARARRVGYLKRVPAVVPHPPGSQLQGIIMDASPIDDADLRASAPDSGCDGVDGGVGELRDL